MAETTQTTDDVIDAAQDLVRLVLEAESENRTQAEDDLAFLAGDQWPAQVYTARTTGPNPRVCLTINKLPAFRNQVVNDARQNRPGLMAHPVDDQADVQVAEIIEGLIRHIIYASNGETAWDVAYESAVDVGWGYFRLYTDYVGDDSFDQDIKFGQLPNVQAVYFDPHSLEPDGCDAQQCVLTELLSRREFERLYPDADANDTQLIGHGDLSEAWLSEDSVQVAEYYRCEYVPDVLCQLSTGQMAWQSQLQGLPPGLQVLRQRPVQRKVIKWYKLTAVDVLEERVWPGKWIPVVPVYGSSVLVRGKRKRFGLLHFLKDPQQMLNYWETTKTELLALMPRAKWLVAAGQVEGFEAQWRNANLTNYPYLEYNQVDDTGQPAPMPQRQGYEGPPAGILQAALMANQHLKEVSGIHDASLGYPGNETSGRAIQARQAQGDDANFHYYDNLTRSLRHAGRIILDLIPSIYDAPRVVRILGEDKSAKPVQINQPQVNNQGVVTVVNDVTVGQYDVVLTTGPSYQTKRQEAAAGMSDLAKAYPPLMQVAGDVLVSNLDWPGAQEIADRLKRTIPPQVLGSDQDQDPAAHAAQLQGQVQQMQQQLHQLNAYGQQAEQQVQALQQQQQQLAQENQMLKQRHDIELLKVQLQYKEAELRAQAEIEKAKLAWAEEELERTKTALEHAHRERGENRLDRQEARQALREEQDADRTPDVAAGEVD